MNATSDGQKTSGFPRENQAKRHRRVSCEGLQNRFGDCRFSRYLRGSRKANPVRAGTSGPVQRWSLAAAPKPHSPDLGMLPKRLGWVAGNGIYLAEMPAVSRSRGSEVFLPIPRLPRRSAASMPAHVSPVSKTAPSSRVGHCPRFA